MVRACCTVILLAAACGGRPESRHQPAVEPSPPAAGAALADAGHHVLDASGEDARDLTDAVTTRDELGNRLGLLYSEHSDFWGGVEWLVAHPIEAREPLRALVQETDFTLGSKRAFIALGRISDVRDVPLLVSVLRRPDDTYRWAAANALAEHESDEAEIALIQALSDSDASVVDAAIGALGSRRSEAARPRLEALLDHPSDGTRYRVVLTLKDLGHEKSAAALRRRARVEKGKYVRKALEDLGY